MTTNAKGNPRNKQEIQESAKHFASPQPNIKFNIGAHAIKS
jgi:hypothetical protein